MTIQRTPLPDSFKEPWDNWVLSLAELEKVYLSRQYYKHSFQMSNTRTVHIFSDASKDAIGAVAYLQLFGSHDLEPSVSFLLGKRKLAPNGGNTIPGMELCAAVELADIIREELDISKQDFGFYTDILVVLGYLTNTTRRFCLCIEPSEPDSCIGCA